MSPKEQGRDFSIEFFLCGSLDVTIRKMLFLRSPFWLCLEIYSDILLKRYD
jgi:hypothetical protein